MSQVTHATVSGSLSELELSEEKKGKEMNLIINRQVY